VGFHLEHITYEPNPIFWVWTAHSWLRDRLRGSGLADRAFPPVGIFRPSIQSFGLLSTFTLVDVLLRTLTGRTGSMSVALRKPAAPV
jgi:hypothetical protein